jgi:hypothetical protein
VPMPGHLIGEGEEEAVQRDVVQLEALIREHDAVFLLLDTREARSEHALLDNLTVQDSTLGVTVCSLSARFAATWSSGR